MRRQLVHYCSHQTSDIRHQTKDLNGVMVELTAIAKYETLSGRTVDYLTELILDRQVAPGQLLPSENELCERLSVSRSTVREAVSVLEARGLVQRRHGVGILVTDRSHAAFVSSLGLMLRYNRSRLQDLLEARIGLECLVAELAAARATEADVRELTETIEPMRRQSSTQEEYVQADLAFHLLLARASHNDVFAAFVTAVRELLLESIRATYTVDGHTERRLVDHTRVLDAVAGRDPEGAHTAMRDHLGHAEEVLRQLGLVDSAAGEDPDRSREVG